MKIIKFILILLILISCNSNVDDESYKNSQEESTNINENDVESDDVQSDDVESDDVQSDDVEKIFSNNCVVEDGSYTATVSYNNPITGYSADYSLDVEVVDCRVTQIYFPKGGYLDEDHIDSDEIDENGYVMVYGEDNRTYEIQFDL